MGLELDQESQAASTAGPSLALQNYTAEAHNEHNDIDLYQFYPTLQFTVMWILYIAIVGSNSYIIVALLSIKEKTTRMNYFIMQLAVADLLVGLLNVFADIIQHITIAWHAGQFLCKLIKFLEAAVMYASSYILVALSIDRCDAIINPMNFAESWKRVRLLVASAWLVSFLFSIPVCVLHNVAVIQGQVQCWLSLGSKEGWQAWITSVFLALFVIPAVIITICYSLIVRTIWATPRVIKNTSANTMFVLCWAPFMAFMMAQVYELVPATQRVLAAATLAQSLAPLNSAANPLICYLFSPHIRRALRRVICRRPWRRHSERGSTYPRSRGTAQSSLLSDRSCGKAQSSLLSDRSSSTAQSSLLTDVPPCDSATAARSYTDSRVYNSTTYRETAKL